MSILITIGWVSGILGALILGWGLLELGRWLGHDDRQWLGFSLVPTGTIGAWTIGRGGATFVMNQPGFWLARSADVRRINKARMENHRALQSRNAGTGINLRPPKLVREWDVIPYEEHTLHMEPGVAAVAAKLWEKRSYLFPFAWKVPGIFQRMWYNFEWVETQIERGQPLPKARARAERVTIMKVSATSYYIEIPNARTRDQQILKLIVTFDVGTTNPYVALIQNQDWLKRFTDALVKYVLEYAQSSTVEEILVETDGTGQTQSVFSEFAQQMNHTLNPSIGSRTGSRARTLQDVQHLDEGAIKQFGVELLRATILGVIDPADRVLAARQDAEIINLTEGARNAALKERMRILGTVPQEVAVAQALGSGFSPNATTVVLGGNAMVGINPPQQGGTPPAPTRPPTTPTTPPPGPATRPPGGGRRQQNPRNNRGGGGGTTP